MFPFFKIRLLVFCLALHGVSSMARGQEAGPQVTVVGIRNPLQVNYRFAHSALKFSDTYAGLKDAVRALFQLIPLVPDLDTSPLTLTVEGVAVNEPIALTSSLTAVIPLNQKAFDEDAVISINRKPDAYRMMFSASVALIDSGAYTPEYLSAACSQVFDFVRAQSFRVRLRTIGKRCVGVKFRDCSAPMQWAG